MNSSREWKMQIRPFQTKIRCCKFSHLFQWEELSCSSAAAGVAREKKKKKQRRKFPAAGKLRQSQLLGKRLDVTERSCHKGAQRLHLHLQMGWQSTPPHTPDGIVAKPAWVWKGPQLPLSLCLSRQMNANVTEQWRKPQILFAEYGLWLKLLLPVQTSLFFPFQMFQPNSQQETSVWLLRSHSKTTQLSPDTSIHYSWWNSLINEPTLYKSQHECVSLRAKRVNVKEFQTNRGPRGPTLAACLLYLVILNANLRHWGRISNAVGPSAPSGKASLAQNMALSPLLLTF